MIRYAFPFLAGLAPLSAVADPTIVSAIGITSYVLPSEPQKGTCFIFDYGDQQTDSNNFKVVGNGHLIFGGPDIVLNTRFVKIELYFDGREWTDPPMPDPCFEGKE